MLKKCRYKNCEPLALTCPTCSAVFNCPSITSSVCASISKKPETDESDSTFWLKLHCLKCQPEGSTGRISPAMIANQVGKAFVEKDRNLSKFLKVKTLYPLVINSFSCLSGEKAD